jgi:hypothetical protein
MFQNFIKYQLDLFIDYCNILIMRVLKNTIKKKLLFRQKLYILHMIHFLDIVPLLYCIIVPILIENRNKLITSHS